MANFVPLEVIQKLLNGKILLIKLYNKKEIN